MMFPKPIYLILKGNKQIKKHQVIEKSSGIEDKLKETLKKPLLSEKMNENETEEIVKNLQFIKNH